MNNYPCLNLQLVHASSMIIIERLVDNHNPFEWIRQRKWWVIISALKLRNETSLSIISQLVHKPLRYISTLMNNHRHISGNKNSKHNKGDTEGVPVSHKQRNYLIYPTVFCIDVLFFSGKPRTNYTLGYCWATLLVVVQRKSHIGW